MELNIHRIIRKSTAEGYGSRFCIWTQGCSIRCEDCENKDTWEFDVGERWDVDSLVKMISSEVGIDGITILGGEPLDQISAISELCTKVKRNGFSVILFTGYSILEELKLQNCVLYKLLASIDLLIDGPFKRDQIYEAPILAGSRNQKVHYLTDYFINRKYAVNNKFEIRIESDGVVKINGMGDILKMKKVLEEII